MQCQAVHLPTLLNRDKPSTHCPPRLGGGGLIGSDGFYADYLDPKPGNWSHREVEESFQEHRIVGLLLSQKSTIHTSDPTLANLKTEINPELIAWRTLLPCR